MRTVGDILQSKTKPFNVIPPYTLVIDALQMLKAIDVDFLVVMDDEKYVGIFSEKEYSRNVILKGRSSFNTVVSEVMTTDLPVVNTDTSAEYCMKLMDTAGVHYLLAFKGEKLLGIITMDDLLHEVLANKEFVFDEDEKGRIF